MLSESVRAEGDIDTQFGEIAKANLEVAIGSYPFFDPARIQHECGAACPRRADARAAKRAVEGMLERVRAAQSTGR
jgi:hypothetical protein